MKPRGATKLVKPGLPAARRSLLAHPKRCFAVPAARRTTCLGKVPIGATREGRLPIDRLRHGFFKPEHGTGGYA